MAATPTPPSEGPQTGQPVSIPVVPTTPPVSQSPVRTNGSAPDWKQVGAAVGALIAVFGGVYSTISSGSARQSAETAVDARYVTQEAAAKYRDQLHDNDVMTHENRHIIEDLRTRVRELEKWRAVIEAKKP